VRSVAKLTRADGAAFMTRATATRIATSAVVYPLRLANEALADQRATRFDGAAVLVPG
jgi:propanol-preferring alcohol dehydrogenase